jgi:hypothetical protein
MAGAVLHVVVTIIEQRPTTDWEGGGVFCSVLHIAMQRSKRRGKVAVDMIAG